MIKKERAWRKPGTVTRGVPRHGRGGYVVDETKKALSAYGLFYEKKAQAALSLTNAELTNGTNWQMVINIVGNTPVTIEAKVITIAHIICQVSAS